MKWVLMDGHNRVHIGSLDDTRQGLWPIKINKNHVPLPYTGKSLAEAICACLNKESPATVSEQAIAKNYEAMYHQQVKLSDEFEACLREAEAKLATQRAIPAPAHQSPVADFESVYTDNLEYELDILKKKLCRQADELDDANHRLAVQTAIAHSLRAELEGLEEKKEPNAQLLTALKFMVGAFNTDPIDPLVAFICIERANKVIEDYGKKKE